MRLVVGLGNVGKRYEQTRHNAGFFVVDELARRWSTSPPKTAFDGTTVEATFKGEKLLLLKPSTLMNLSGRSVRQAVAFYKVPLESILVVCDDMNIPLGTMRARASGTAGGQNGLADVLAQLGSTAVPRLRIGVSRPPASWDPADYVLSKFTAAETPLFQVVVQEAADAVEVWVHEGLAACMNRFNKKGGA